MASIFKSEKVKSLIPYFLFALAVLCAYKVITEIGFIVNIIGKLWGIIVPFFYGFLLAYVMNIPFSFVQRLLGKSKNKFIVKKSKLLSSIVTIAVFALVLFLVLYFIIPYVHKIVAFFIASLPVYYERTLEYIDFINNLDLFDVTISQERILSFLQDIIANISIENLMSPINALFSVSSSIFTGFLAIVSSIYILAEKEKLKAFLRRMLTAFTPGKIAGNIMEYSGRLNRNFRRYIFVQTIDGCILGTIVGIELFLLRSPYALILGIILGVVNYIPYFGSIIGSLVAILIVAFTQGLSMAAIAAVVLLVTQQIDGNFIQPKLMGGSFSLSPFLVIISITIGGVAAGVLGMISAIPIVAVLKDILERVIEYYEGKKGEPKEIKT